METETETININDTLYCIIWTDENSKIHFHYCSCANKEKAIIDFFRTENPENIEGYEITRTDEVHYVGEHI